MINLASVDPKRLKHLLTIGFMVQFTAWFLEGWMYGTSYGRFFLFQGLKDQNGIFLERILLCTALLSFFGLFSEKKPQWSWLLFIYPSLEIINVFLMVSDSQKPGVEFSFLASMGRVGFPIALYFLIKSQFSFTKFIENIFGIFIGLTFIGHGLKALIQEPEYQDYLYFLFGLLPTNTFPPYSLITNSLNTIGVIDILLGIIIILKPCHKKILLYLCLWGFLTATLRPLYSGSDGLLPFFLRIPHWLIPLSLLIWSHNHKRGTNL
tara:strand:- start:117 stop:911 length:795 start_codon:yes stop_codon:yes gene_type:complete